VKELNEVGESKKRYDVFITYGHGVRDRVIALIDALELRGIKCYTDKNEIRGSGVDSLAGGIDASKGSLVIVTEAYMRKVNSDGEYCRMEYD